MKQETRNLLIILTGILTGASHMYLGTPSVIVDGYIIANTLGILARKVIEPRDKGTEVIELKNWDSRGGYRYGLLSRKGERIGLIATIILILGSVVVSYALDKGGNIELKAYTYTLGGLIMCTALYENIRGLKVYDKGIQKGFRFYSWEEVEVKERYKGSELELIFINNLIFKDYIKIKEGREKIRELKEKELIKV